MCKIFELHSYQAHVILAFLLLDCFHLDVIVVQNRNIKKYEKLLKMYETNFMYGNVRFYIFFKEITHELELVKDKNLSFRKQSQKIVLCFLIFILEVWPLDQLEGLDLETQPSSDA